MVTVTEVKRVPVLNFVPRIRGARDVLKLTPAAFAQRAQANRKNPDPGFTLQEYMKGDTEVHPYLDWDCKYREDDGDSEEERKAQLSEFQSVVSRLFPTAGSVVYAQRHGVIGDPEDTSREWKRKVSYRAWVLGIRCTVSELPAYIRRVLGMGPKHVHPHLDLSVYKTKEQLLGVVYSCKDIDTVKRYLVPLDKTESLENFLAQNVSEDDVLLSSLPVPEPEKGIAGASSGVAQTKKGKGKGKKKAEEKAEANAEPEDVPSNSMDDSGVGKSSVEILSGDKYASVFETSTRYFRKQYQIQEKLKVIHVNREDKYLIFPTTKKWCFIKEDEHVGNNPYIVVTEWGSRWKCFDEICKKAGEVKLTPFSELPKEIRDLYAETFYEAEEKDMKLMSEAKVECVKNIVENFPEESSQDLDVNRMGSLLTTLAKCQQCRYCKSTKIQIDHQMNGWQSKCNECQKMWPSKPVPIGEVDFPKLCMYLTQLNIGTVNINNNITNIYNGAQVDFYADFSGDDLVVFKEDPHLNDLFIGSLQGTDTMLSRFTTEYFKDRFHCTDEKLWYEFSGHCWNDKAADLSYKEAMGEDAFLNHYRNVALHFESLPIQNDDTKRKARMVRKLCVQLEDGKQREKIVVDSIMKFHNRRPNFARDLNTQNILVFNDGVFDFGTFTFGTGHPDVPVTMKVTQPFIPYDADNDHVKFLMQFMEAILPDASVRDYMLKVMGICLTLDTSLQLFWVLTGTGSNGKGRLMNLLEECLGTYYQAVSPAMLTRKRESANEANEALMALVKARLAVFQEPEAGEVIQAGTVKAITGEDTLSSRVNYGKQTKFRPKFKSFLVANDLPATSEATVALFRRVRIINFPTSFVEEPKLPHERQIDYQLDKKLKAAAPHFIAVLIHHYERFVKEGLKEPTSVRDSTKKYQNDNDVIKQFKDETLLSVKDGVGLPSQDHYICWTKVGQVFQKWYLKQTLKAATAKHILKLRDSFGPFATFNWARSGWIKRVGYEYQGDKKSENFKGWPGYKWKDGVLETYD